MKTTVDKGSDLSIEIVGPLSSGALFQFQAYWDKYKARWDIAFTLDRTFNPEEITLSAKDKLEVSRFLLQIWERFKRYPCVCYPATPYHKQVYRKLGFQVMGVKPDEYMLRYP